MAGSLSSEKVRANTLLETMIAMTVIVIISAIAMLIFGQVTRSSVSLRGLRAAQLMEKDMGIAEQHPTSLQDSSYTENDLTISRTIQEFPNNARLIIVSLKATDMRNDSIGGLTKIVRK